MNEFQLQLTGKLNMMK